MSDPARPYAVLFPPWFDEQAELEMPARGYLQDVDVRFDEGANYRLYFTDPVRVRQDAERTFETGGIVLAEPGLVVIPEVTRGNILAAVEQLFADKFFEHLRPVPVEKAAVPNSHP
jgi:hypothetical protein